VTTALDRENESIEEVPPVVVGVRLRLPLDSLHGRGLVVA